MADATGVNSALPTRLGGVSSTSGLPDYYADIDTHGSQYAIIRDSSGNAIGDQSLSASYWLQSVTPSNGPAIPGVAASFSTLVGGQYNSTLPSPTNTQQTALQQDYKARLITAPVSLSYFHPIYTTRIQSAKNTNSVNGTSLATTINATQSGNLIVVTATSISGALTCTDSTSQAYTAAVTGVSGNLHSYIFYKANTAAGVISVTISDGTSTALNMVVCEYADVSATPLDQTQSNVGAASTSFTSNATSATTQANELLVGSCFDTAHNNTTFTAGTNWNSVATQQNGAGGGGTLFQEEQYVAATGTYAATGTLSQSDAYIAGIVTFKITPPTNLVNTTSATVIKSSAGTLASIAINTLGSNSASVTFYDGTSTSGTVIANVSLTTSLGSIPYNLHFTNGLTMLVNSTTADFTVIYD